MISLKSQPAPSLKVPTSYTHLSEPTKAVQNLDTNVSKIRKQW